MRGYYWLSSTYDYISVWHMNSSYLCMDDCYNSAGGVCPVIIVSTADVQNN